jgi:uncharacterized protein YjcR
MRSTTWNIGKAYRLWMAAMPTESIASSVGVTVSALKKAARVQGWPKRRSYNGRIAVQPAVMKKRCEGCLAVYLTTKGHDCGKSPQSIYLAAA